MVVLDNLSTGPPHSSKAPRFISNDLLGHTAAIPSGIPFENVDIRDAKALDVVFAKHKPDAVMASYRAIHSGLILVAFLRFYCCI